MNYEVVKPTNPPAWFTPGIRCKVWNYNKDHAVVRTVAWHYASAYITDDGTGWFNAEPIEVWIPKVGEPVAVWNTTDNYYKVYPFNTDTIGKYITTCDYFCNVAKYDGQRDMRVEALKDAPRHKRS